MEPMLSNFGFDMPNLSFLSFDLTWRKGGRKRVCVRWQDGGARFSLTLRELVENLADHGVGPRVAKSLCACHGQEMLGQVREWLDREGRQLAFEAQRKQKREQDLREQSEKLVQARQIISRLMEIGTDPEELHEMVRQASVEVIHDS